MPDKQKTQLAVSLLQSLIGSTIITDKASADEVIALMNEMNKKAW